MSRDIEKILDYSKKALDFIVKKELNDEEVSWVNNEILTGFRDSFSPGFFERHKEVASRPGSQEGIHPNGNYASLVKNNFINCLGGYGTYNIGHRHPRVVEALKNEMERQVLNGHELFDPLSAMLSRLVSMITPGELQISLFTNIGREPVEGALKLARISTGRTGIVAAVRNPGGRNGCAARTVPVTGCFIPGQAEEPVYREVPFGDADTLEQIIAASSSGGCETAAVILEPILSSGGVIVPPDDYLEQVRDICNRYKALLIIDETETGIGQTGKLFAIEHYEVAPDILCIGRAFGGGVVPIGAFVSTLKVWQTVNTNPFVHMYAYDANPLACAAAIAGIRVILDEGLVEQAAEKGNYFLPRIQFIAGRSRIITEARGKGLLIGIEFVDSQTSYRAAQKLFEKEILVSLSESNPATVCIEPPLNISIAEIDRIIEALEEISRELDI